ncbi:hypothetical protein HZB03_01035, partial [Candidatus Woesearchaeota archaeon]|nr:hypothetical protein [Candidatus Woesearchaeota archaeon]
MKSVPCSHFNLQHTIESGQLFRFEKKDGGYFINAADRFFFAKQENNKLFFDGNVDERLIAHFFRLDEDHCETIGKICHDKHVANAVESYRGIRLLRQDPFECIISFICSSASNIPRIHRNVNDIARLFGEKKTAIIQGQKYGYFAFPKSGMIDDERRLAKVRLGYRAKFLLQSNSTVTQKFLKELNTKRYCDAKTQLMTLPGVGEKVADCILLFSCGHLNAFPVDTWISKVMSELYFSKECKKN